MIQLTLNDTFKCEKIPMIKSNQINNTLKTDLCPNIDKAGQGVDEWKGQNAKNLFDQDQKVMPSAVQGSLKRDINLNVEEEVCVEKGNSKKKKNKKQNKSQNQKLQSMCPLVPVADNQDGESVLTKPPSQCGSIQNQESVIQAENRHLSSADDGDTTFATNTRRARVLCVVRGACAVCVACAPSILRCTGVRRGSDCLLQGLSLDSNSEHGC